MDKSQGRTVEIEAIGTSGDGIVRTSGKPVFVPFGVTGDTIELTAPPLLVNPSQSRVAPPCPHHGNIGKAGCGGCRMQQLADDAYRAWKRGLVLHALRGLTIDQARVGPMLVSPPRSRRRAALAAERRGGKVRLGFSERGSQRIVDMQTCLVLRPELFALARPLRDLPLLRDGERADYILAICAGDIDLVIERRRELAFAEREAVAEFAYAHDLARISWRAGPRREAEPVVHLRPVRAASGAVLPPGGFLQATEEGEAALISAVIAALPESARTLDLFAGSGTFTFPAAGKGRVHAVEADDAAVAAIRGVRHGAVTAERRDLFSEPVEDLEGYGAIIFDPPYAGAAAQARLIAGSGVPVVAAVSCNPVSFARDAAVLMEGGYRLEVVTPVDQFLWSAEVEMAGIFRKGG